MSHPASLGKYRVTGVLGEGAMGVVYRGYDPGIRRNVAIKTIRRLGGLSDEMANQLAARFRNEAQAAGRLQHPGIVGIYDYGDDDEVSYIAMEFVEGHTLSGYLARRVAFGEADLASVAVQLLDALGHAHANGVWHRDIKPSNVILTPGGRVKIADFGIARTDNIGLTMAGTMLGTPMYMAPEQFLGQPFDHRVDLYATGVLLYQMLAARPPFTGSQEALMYKVVHEAPLPPSAAEDGMRAPRYDAVVLRALAKGPPERWSDAGAFAAAIAAALGTRVPSAVAPAVVNALPPPPGFEPT
ncbi:MAG: serine/threonine protein kinase, partial [Burkholderiales bacterium]|nr:serine/threonine protein kinase [Burkholderiales bacterium]